MLSAAFALGLGIIFLVSKTVSSFGTIFLVVTIGKISVISEDFSASWGGFGDSLTSFF